MKGSNDFNTIHGNKRKKGDTSEDMKYTFRLNFVVRVINHQLKTKVS